MEIYSSSRDVNDLIWSQLENAEVVKLYNSVFETECGFNCLNVVDKPVIISDCTFKGYFGINSNFFKKGTEIHDCIFEGRFSISGCNFESDLTIRNCEFQGIFEIIDSYFNGKTVFHFNDYNKGMNIFQRRDSFGSVEFKGELSLF